MAIDVYGIPGVLLMENAARQLADAVAACGAPSLRVLVVCGAGNNGGDGYAAARHLDLRGHAVRVLSLTPIERLTGDARTMANIAVRCDIGMTDDVSAIAGGWDVIVDAIFGTGLSRPPEGEARAAIEAINAVADCAVVAADVPSGLDCDTGQLLGACVRADVTVTFVRSKTGFDVPGAEQFTGRVVVADVGTPQAIVEKIVRAE
jgi:NAD(P)H-hydrate epimerase